MLYAIQYDSEDTFVEATDFAQAIDVWRKHRLGRWRTDDDYEPGDKTVNPEQVRLIGDYVVRRTPLVGSAMEYPVGADHLLSVRFREALQAITGEVPPVDFDPTDERCFDRIQDWCNLNAKPEWSTGIGIYEAAEHILAMALDNGNLTPEGEGGFY